MELKNKEMIFTEEEKKHWIEFFKKPLKERQKLVIDCYRAILKAFEEVLK